MRALADKKPDYTREPGRKYTYEVEFADGGKATLSVEDEQELAAYVERVYCDCSLPLKGKASTGQARCSPAHEQEYLS